jgi:hypothetical protein
MGHDFFQCLECCGSSQCNFLKVDMYEIWDGDLFLYTVDTEFEADEQAEAGFTVKIVEYYGA